MRKKIATKVKPGIKKPDEELKIDTSQQEHQQTFLLRFSDALRAENNPDAILNLALQMLFAHLKLDCCYIGIFHMEQDYGEFPYQVRTDTFPPLPKGVRLSDFPEALLKSFTSTLVMDDILNDNSLSDIDKQSFIALGYRGLAVATVRKGENNPLWSIVAVASQPRHWMPGEIRVLEEATERTWAAVERAKAEETLKKLNETLTLKKKEAEDALNKEKLINEELRRINQVMDTFIYSAAHDLKAPVSNLKLVTEVIAATDDKELKLQLLDQYPTAIKTLDQVISGLIRVLAIEKNPGPIKDLQFQAVFNKVSKELTNIITEADPKIQIDFSSCNSIIYIESYLFSIFRNTLSNALKYRSEERKLSIDIQSRYEGKYAVLTISDNGTGIDMKTYGKDLFKPFKRFNQQIEGSGIGLHLIKNIVTKNGGKVEVESQSGTGTTFKIYLVPYIK
ncbi:MAG TPA: GAF domain-containing sensor histidine kinase [Bacteroidales bacterium]|nr:GAF domain-containing sensor histidine kinase [Bacteroidales bacterium]